MTKERLLRLADRLGTPSYVFDEDVFAERVNFVKEAFGEKVGICYSIKANPFLLSGLPDCFDKIEVCSPGELTICEKVGADMSKVIFSGVNKTAESVKRAMDDNVGTFTAESMLHMKLIEECAVASGKRVPVLVRLAASSQFGMDEADVMSIIEHRADYKGIEIVGLHYFTGTQKKKPKTILKELNRVGQLVDRIRDELGFEIECVEYGTGLAVDYFDSQANELEAERLEGISEAVREMGKKVHLTVEMGRFFAAPCGYYLTKVIDVKNNGGVNYAICDGGLNQLKYDGQIQGMLVPEIIHLKGEGNRGSGDVQPWMLCGSLCTTADILTGNVPLESLEIGDTLVFCRTGAYSVMEGMAVFLSRELPRVSLYSANKGIVTVRDFIDTDIFNTPNFQSIS